MLSPVPCPLIACAEMEKVRAAEKVEGEIVARVAAREMLARVDVEIELVNVDTLEDACRRPSRRETNMMGLVRAGIEKVLVLSWGSPAFAGFIFRKFKQTTSATTRKST